MLDGMDTYETVAFISVEAGDDLIVSFFVARPSDLSGGRSIILMRDKKWEHLIPESERGVKVSDEGFPDEEEWHDNFLEQARLGDSSIELKSKLYDRKLDLSRIEKSDLKAIRKLLKKMNFDQRFELVFI
jgi:hypothetical protein